MSVQLPDGATVKDIIEKVSKLGAPKNHISMVLVNGEDADEKRPLRNGDAVTIIGEASGM
jgi:molybdopterin converting factor small subunit